MSARPSRWRAAAGAAAVAPAALLLLASCAGPRNYTELRGPRWEGCCVPAPPAVDSLKVVTFNIKFSQEIDRAIRLFERTPVLRDAGVVFLQEMDQEGVSRIARALGYNYVYYPATLHPGAGHNFGDAILARWPIESPRKILLPHLGRFGKTLRIGVTGTVRLGDRRVQLYSVHLATPAEVSEEGQHDQARTLAHDADSLLAAGAIDAVILGGDLNATGVRHIFVQHMYANPTEDLGPTTYLFSLDHIFIRGVGTWGTKPAGIVEDNFGASDHSPVWTVVDLRSIGAVDAAPGGTP